MRNITIISVVLSSLILVGCQSKGLYYASEGHLGVDISGTGTAPTNISVDGSTREISIIPAKSDGSSHSVYGGLDTRLQYLKVPAGNKVSQNFATGEAAVCALYSKDPVALASYKSQCESINEAAPVKPVPAIEDYRDRTLAIVTHSKVGLDIHYGEGEAVGSNFGYKRLVAAAIPVMNSSEEVGSVYLDITVDSLTDESECKKTPEGEATKTPKTCLTGKGMKISQTIATGTAAKLMAIANSEKLISSNEQNNENN